MVRIGAHMPISKGFESVPELTVQIGGNCFQIFPHSPRTWTAKMPSRKTCELFRAMMEKHQIDFESAFCHTGYLINLASPIDENWNRSVQLLILEGKICEALGIRYLNAHPGSHTGAGEELGFERITAAVNEFLKNTKDVMLLLENVSPKGGNIGYNFDQIKRIIDSSIDPSRIGITYDTCHGFDAGYDITTEDAVRKLLHEIDSKIGLEKLKMIHLNDSKAPLGKPTDRHENIGKGFIGEKGFRVFLSFEEIQRVPWILETPGDEAEHAQDIAKVKEILGLM
ncbi:deoxyribonuclease IV [Thermotoga caldifontis]|uniref:deoxyribonuclease IV n=1 Tax=Thermotoga caldifontis TaxID=1508419 RepID=UPI000596D67E|nr:deoxyribonuclease IV [Thermotoga caldifontis]